MPTYILSRALAFVLLAPPIFTGCAPDSDTQRPTTHTPCRSVGDDYPVTIAPFTQEERDCVKNTLAEIAKENPDSWLKQKGYLINPWGEFSDEFGYCPMYSQATTFTEAEAAPFLEKVKESMKLLSPLLGTKGIADLSQPEFHLCRAGCWDTCKAYSSAVFWFGEQSVDGRKVPNSNLNIIVVPGKIEMIRSDWRPDVSISQTPKVSEAEGRPALIGTKLKYSCANGIHMHEITAKTIGLGKLVVFRLVENQNPTYRLAWEYSISRDSWLIYLDAITGEIIERHQLFICD